MGNIDFEISFSELRCREIINVRDGRRLGRITDIVFSGESSKLKGIVAPFTKRSLFSKGQDIFIPWRCITKIGEDVIIVDVNADGSCDPGVPVPECDRRCERCGRRDCRYRSDGPQEV